MEYIIETNKLTKTFPGKIAVNKIDMHVKRGDIYGFIGKNGAGKTTAMKLILGLLNPTSGGIKIFNNENLNSSRYKIGSLIESPGLYKNFSAYENLKRFSILYGGTEEDINELLKLVNLENVGNKPVRAFSFGMKQRLGIAIALLGNPEILILDEPINGLDPSGIKDLRDLILKLNKEKQITFIISSHILDELSKIATRYGIINNGILVEEISSEELTNRYLKYMKLNVSDVNKTISILQEQNLLDKYETKENNIFLYNNFDKSGLINTLLVNNNIIVNEISFKENNLEDYFVERI